MPTGSAGSSPVALRDELGNALLDALSLNLYDETTITQGQQLASVQLVAAGHVDTVFLTPINGRFGTALVLQEDGLSAILAETSDRISLDQDSAYVTLLANASVVATGLAGFSVANGSLGISYSATDRLLFDAPISNRLLLEDGVSTFILEGSIGYQLPSVGMAAQGVVTSLGAPSGTASYTLDTVVLTATGINFGVRTGSLLKTLENVVLHATGTPVKNTAQHGHRDHPAEPTPSHREPARTPAKGRRSPVSLTPGTRHG